MLLKNVYYKPTNRHTNKTDMVDLVMPAPSGGTYSIASYIRREYADEIIAALEMYSAQHGVEPTVESVGALPAISNQSDDELPF